LRRGASLASVRSELDRAWMDAPESAAASLLEAEPSPLALLDVPPPDDVRRGRHPDVRRALESMGEELHDLKDRQQTVRANRESLAGAAGEVALHLGLGSSLKGEMVLREERVKDENLKVERLKASEQSVDEVRAKLDKRLHAIMDRRIHFAEKRFRRHQSQLARLEKDASAWASREASYKAKALGTVQAKHAALEAVRAADDAIQKAETEARVANRDYLIARENANRDVMAYEDVAEKTKAFESRRNSERDSADAEEASAKRLSMLLSKEERKLDDQISEQKESLQRQERKARSVGEKAVEELRALQKKYAEWQVDHSERTEEFAKQKRSSDAVSDAFASRQREVLDAAKANVVARKMPLNDEYDWAWPSLLSVREGRPPLLGRRHRRHRLRRRPRGLLGDEDPVTE